MALRLMFCVGTTPSVALLARTPSVQQRSSRRSARAPQRGGRCIRRRARRLRKLLRRPHRPTLRPRGPRRRFVARRRRRGLLRVDRRAPRAQGPGAARPARGGHETHGRPRGVQERKLFTLNAGHAITAYLGYLAKHSIVAEAIADACIAAGVRGALHDEAGAALRRKHRFSEEEHGAYIETILALCERRGERTSSRTRNKCRILYGPHCLIRTLGTAYNMRGRL
ncbi:hypothetical protein B0H17DRAFT_555143 [Mycena rosella]|uniref:Mannitol dehydrogenase C-terminal domain-containing protein n=1 Tax=Mycena rosella TaxID=1033263 RepID=A0AAD7DHV4_MYCRO|nr:hypothetical protein B0H17DRAFT_555143 [Mycena rosella]